MKEGVVVSDGVKARHVHVQLVRAKTSVQAALVIGSSWPNEIFNE